jgi:hypothetical protein
MRKYIWVDQEGKSHYISIFPEFIIKYCKLHTGLIDKLSNELKEKDDLFKYISDSDNQISCEDEILIPMKNLQKRSKEILMYLTKDLVTVFNTDITEIVHGSKKFMFPVLKMIYQLSKILHPFESPYKRLNSQYYFG